MNYNVGATFSGRPSRKIHPWLMVCFVVGWGLLGTLAILQDHAIDAQRELINLLLQDLHTGLTTSIGHRTGTSVPVVMKPGAAAQIPSNQLPSQQVQQSTPSVQVPSLQVPSVPLSKVPSHSKGSRTPSSQGKNAEGVNPGQSSRKAVRPLPVRPPAEITDPSDMRRVKFST